MTLIQTVIIIIIKEKTIQHFPLKHYVSVTKNYPTTFSPKQNPHLLTFIISQQACSHTMNSAKWYRNMTRRKARTEALEPSHCRLIIIFNCQFKCWCRFIVILKRTQHITVPLYSGIFCVHHHMYMFVGSTSVVVSSLRCCKFYSILSRSTSYHVYGVWWV